MNKSKNISKGKTYKEIGDYWDRHDLSEVWDKTREVDFELSLKSELTYYSLDKVLSDEIQSMARKRGVSADTLINLWLQEKLMEQKK